MKPMCYYFPNQKYKGLVYKELDDMKIYIQNTYIDEIAVVQCSMSIVDNNMLKDICESMPGDFFKHNDNKGHVAILRDSEVLLVRYTIRYMEEYNCSEYVDSEITPERFVNFFIDEFDHRESIEAFHVAGNNNLMVLVSGEVKLLINVISIGCGHGKTILLLPSDNHITNGDVLDFIDNTVCKFIYGFKEFSTSYSYKVDNIRFVHYKGSTLKLEFKQI